MKKIAFASIFVLILATSLVKNSTKEEDFYDFETDILDKFSSLIEIENFSKKL